MCLTKGTVNVFKKLVNYITIYSNEYYLAYTIVIIIYVILSLYATQDLSAILFVQLKHLTEQKQ